MTMVSASQLISYIVGGSHDLCLLPASEKKYHKIAGSCSASHNSASPLKAEHLVLVDNL